MRFFGRCSDSRDQQNRPIGEAMKDTCLSQIYLVAAERTRPLGQMTLPKDAGWIFTAPDPDVDAVAEHLGDANDRPVQIVRALGERDVDQNDLAQVIDACARSGPNPVLVVNADLADTVLQLASAYLTRVEDLTQS